MAQILITGGAGYIGSHCAKALALAGHDGVVFDNLLFGHREFVRWGPLSEGDIRNVSALDAIFSAYRFDAVMLDAMVRAGVGLIIFSSSCTIYGEPDSTPITEHMVHNPINPYGFSKLVCEHMMDDFGRATQ